MVKERQHEDSNEDRLADAIRLLACEIHEMNQQNSSHILDRLNRINFRLSRIARFLAALDAQT